MEEKFKRRTSKRWPEVRRGEEVEEEEVVVAVVGERKKRTEERTF